MFRDLDDFFESSYSTVFVAVNSLTLLLMSLSLLFYAFRMKKNVMKSTDLVVRDRATLDVKNTTSALNKELGESFLIKLKLLTRINRILAILLACYTLRVISLGYIFVLYLKGIDTVHATRPLTTWLLVSWLIPAMPVSFDQHKYYFIFNTSFYAFEIPVIGILTHNENIFYKSCDCF